MTEPFRTADISLAGDNSCLTFPPSRPATVTSARLPGAKSAPCLRRESKSYRAPSMSFSKAHPTDETETGIAEIQSIMQHTLGVQTPPTTFLGVSPPRRQSGAANPLNQGSKWHLDACLSSRSNLQALREIDARGVSFLKVSGPLDSTITLDSSSESAAGEPSRYAAKALKMQQDKYRPHSCMRVGIAKPLMSQVGFNVA